MSEKTGRFEYVKRGIVGVAAATLLTGLCAVPAFALAANEGATAVTVNTETLQYNVTMPTSTLVGSLSGQDGTLTLGTATIKNESVFSIQLSSIAVSGDNGIVLKKSGNAYTDATDKNAASAQIAVDGQNLDLADLKTKPVLDAPVFIGTGTEESLALTGSMKNLSASLISDTPFSFATITWTVSPGDAPVA